MVYWLQRNKIKICRNSRTIYTDTHVQWNQAKKTKNQFLSTCEKAKQSNYSEKTLNLI